MDILTYQLSAPLSRAPQADLAAWMDHLARCPFTAPIERALWAGLHADRIAYAFVGGYGAALAQLVSSLPRRFPTQLSLCATESGGAHPRQIATRLDADGGRLRLVGEKTFATLATVADELLVVASEGIDGGGKNRLRLVRVRPDAKGVEIVEKAPLPFAPELPHAVVRLRGVSVDDADVLPGDGYDDYLKPFRTVEDTHVLAATVGYLIGVARTYGFDRAIVTELAALTVVLVDLAARAPGEPLTHLLLAGAFATLRRVNASLGPEWDRVSPDERARWLRDQPILMVADGVRNQRTASAWTALEAFETKKPGHP